MAETRIERFREYRKSIINGSDDILKTPIDTSLKTTSKESQSSPNEQEAVFLKKINRRKIGAVTSFSIFVLAIIVPLIVFGIFVFKG